MDLYTTTNFENKAKDMNEFNFLNKKTKRNNFAETLSEQNKTKILNKNKKIIGFLSPVPKEKKIFGSKSVIRPVKIQKQFKINDFFEKPNNEKNKENSLNENSILNNIDLSSSFSILRTNKNPKKNIKKKEQKKKIKKNKKKSDDNNINNKSSKDKSNPNNSFVKFPHILNNSKENKLNINNDNYFIDNNIFDKSEINNANNIQKEFINEIKDVSSKIDKLIKITMFFLNKGFNEYNRYHIYKSIINHGFPTIVNFNKFYQNLTKELTHSKNDIVLPEKMLIQFYIEYISNLLINDKMSKAESLIISQFFFNNENIEIIRSNILFIYIVKENKNINNFLQNYLEKNYDIIFRDIDIKLNADFPKAKTILSKILTNVVLECDKVGYLNYKNIATKDNILFSGLEITGNLKEIKFRKMVSIKLFGQEFSDKKFSTVIIDYLVLLFSNIVL